VGESGGEWKIVKGDEEEWRVERVEESGGEPGCALRQGIF
jgi:hypothetical protein